MLTYRFSRPALPAGLVCSLILLALMLSLAPLARPDAGPAAPASPRVGALPLIIMPTGGQAAPFAALGLGGGVAFHPDSLGLDLPGARLRVSFVGASADVRLEPAEQRPGRIGSRIGSDPTRWRAGVPTYAALDYRGLHPGVDLRYDGSASRLKGTYTVAPHADPGAIRWRYEGAAALAIDPASGDLVVSLSGGEALREHAPVAWQELGGRRVPVAARFSLSHNQVGFALGSYDPALPLVIDPTLTLGTYLGGSGADYGRGIDVDAQGNIYVVGDFFSSDFLGFGTTPSGSKDVIVLKLTPAGDDLVYGWFEGGADADEGLAIAVNGAGEAFVLVDPGAGYPTDNAPISSPPAVGDGILMKIDAQGNHVYTTYLGFGLSNIYTGDALAFGPGGSLYVAGETYVAIERLRQLAVAQVNPATGAVLRSFDRGARYAGTNAAALAVGADGRVYLTGSTYGVMGDEFPTTPDAVQRVCGRQRALGPDRDCDSDAYLMVLNSDLSLRYASYLGGNGSDEGRGLALDGQGNAVVVGNVTSQDFPLKNAIRPSCPGDPSLGLCSYDGFVTKIAPAAGIVYSSYITSPGEPEAMNFVTDVAVDAAGNAYVYGFSNATQLPIKDAVQPARSTGICLGAFDRFCFDAFVTGLAPDGSLQFGTYLGGTFDEYSGGIAVDSAGAIYLVGYSESLNFPTSAGSIQPAKSVNSDFFVTRIAPSASPPNNQPTPGPAMPYRVYLPLAIR